MTRLARIVIPGLPHHVTQRGNRRERVFFSDADYQFYLDELGLAAKKAGSEIWAWCLMPNHVHLLIVPADVDGLRLTVANAHRRYASRLNARNRWTGHLWQGRYGSVVMDEAHLYHALAYVSLNPVRARLVERAQDWPWSSARAHLTGTPDGITTLAPGLERVGISRHFLTRRMNPHNSSRCAARKSPGGQLVAPGSWMSWRKGSAERSSRCSGGESGRM